jgi:hypothetical protein
MEYTALLSLVNSAENDEGEGGESFAEGTGGGSGNGRVTRSSCGQLCLGLPARPRFCGPYVS